MYKLFTFYMFDMLTIKYSIYKSGPGTTDYALLPVVFATTSVLCPVMAASPQYVTSAWTAQILQLPAPTPLLRVTQPLPNDGHFFGSTVLAMSKYAVIY
jgi:hypothetical protein